jgi:hypothetical protein
MTIADEAYQQGLADYKRGVRYQDNPYPPSKRTARSAWLRGATHAAIAGFAEMVVPEAEKQEASQ